MKYANDCMSRIVANCYSDSIKLYSDDYNALANEICSINNIENKDTLQTGQEIIVPIPVYDENNTLMGFISPDDEAGEVGDDENDIQTANNI